MTSLVFYTGIGLIGIGIATLIWVVRVKADRYFAAQAMVLMELGVVFIVPSLTPSRTAATIIVGILGAGVLLSVWIQIRLARQWRRNHARPTTG